MKRIDVPSHEIGQILASIRRRIAHELAKPFHEYPSLADPLMGAVAERFKLVCLRGFRVSVEDDTLDDWSERLREVVKLVVEYFFGGWREDCRYLQSEPAFDRAACRRNLAWFDCYRKGVVCASLANDEESLRHLLEWPAEDLPTWHESPEFHPEHLYSHIIIASWARTGTLNRDELFNRVMKSAPRRTRLLIEVIETAIRGDVLELERAIKASIRSFKRSGFRKNRPDRWISIDDSLVCLLLRRAGMELPTLAPEYSDFLLTADDLT